MRRAWLEAHAAYQTHLKTSASATEQPSRRPRARRCVQTTEHSYGETDQNTNTRHATSHSNETDTWAFSGPSSRETGSTARRARKGLLAYSLCLTPSPINKYRIIFKLNKNYFLFCFSFPISFHFLSRLRLPFSFLRLAPSSFFQLKHPAAKPNTELNETLGLDSI